jgi:hypothetical protein
MYWWSRNMPVAQCSDYGSRPSMGVPGKGFYFINRIRPRGCTIFQISGYLVGGKVWERMRHEPNGPFPLLRSDQPPLRRAVIALPTGY